MDSVKRRGCGSKSLCYSANVACLLALDRRCLADERFSVGGTDVIWKVTNNSEELNSLAGIWSSGLNLPS